MFRTSITSKLEAVSLELQRCQGELRILEEQIVQLGDEADAARLRSLVSETPQASQEHREATRALEAAQRTRDAKRKRVNKLEGKLDELLDRLGSETIANALREDG